MTRGVLAPPGALPQGAQIRRESNAELALEKRSQARDIRRTLASKGASAAIYGDWADDLDREAAALLVPASSPIVAAGEVVPTDAPGIVDTLQQPDQAAIDASLTREGLLVNRRSPDLLALGIDAAVSIKATNSMEKMLAHQLALLHALALRAGSRALRYADRNDDIREDSVELARLTNATARASAAYVEGLFALDRLRQGGSQSMSIRHVQVESGGQAVIGPVRGTRTARYGTAVEGEAENER